MLIFYSQQSYFSQIVSKKSQNNNIIFYKKMPKITILFWVFSFMYLVSVYPRNRTLNQTFTNFEITEPRIKKMKQIRIIKTIY